MWSTSIEVFLISWENWKILLIVFTNVPAHETITINTCGESFQRQLVQWHLQPTVHVHVNLSKDQLWELLELATTNQLLQLNGTLCHFMSKTYFQMWTLFSHHIITGSTTNKDEALYYFLTSAATRIEDCPCPITWTNLYLPASRGTDKTTHKYM